jgi:hypothetical protein
MIDLHNEKLISLRELGKEIERGYNNVLQLVKVGRYSVGGKVVKLEAIKTPSGLMTSKDAYYRFVRKLNEC